MAAVVTKSQSKAKGTLRRLVFDWTSHTDGTVTGTSPTSAIIGKIAACITIPGAGGVAPTTLYDVTVINDDGFDVLGGKGADRSATLPEQFVPGVPFGTGAVAGVGLVAVHGTLELRVANAGSGKQGRVVLLLEN